MDCLEALHRQEVDRPFEVLCVDWGSPDAEVERLRDLGARVLAGDEEAFDRGRSANLGAAAARGRILVFLDQHALADDRQWLHRLTAPFLCPNPPAAVQGFICDRLDVLGPSFDLEFTCESRRWKDRHQGIAFSLANAAVRRDIWEMQPFCEGDVLTDRRWQRRVQAGGHLLLPIHAAYVVRRQTHNRRRHFHRFLVEGAAWRSLGVIYGVRDLVADLGDLPPTDDPRQQAIGRLRPPALFAGGLLRSLLGPSLLRRLLDLARRLPAGS